ncbi:MFS transporter [Gordonia otitidis]|uniref:Drug resistance transporter n=1 Tax=Gordonia otitidis (strain DSM 44809 / CCUG 52243 / JCM 12355 / NBRC 100426 / IFM 10032) TaxID=1108044 RepID=H5TPL8_GORO1|nr:MFS transporter [Gordonia otitidis]GAB35426.1 putative drug resistance transporter [Gordonia otitidis NBRC 100426]
MAHTEPTHTNPPRDTNPPAHTNPPWIRSAPLTDVAGSFSTVQRITLAVVCAATAMLMLDIAVVNTALPSMAREFDASMNSLKWVIDGYTLALATVVLSAGAWADRIGRRRVFVVGALVFTAASVLCTVAADIATLNAARVVQGLGAALLFASSLALLAHAFPGREHRTRALAAYGATIGASFAIGPLLGGVLTDWIDWRAIFVVNIPLGVAMLYATRWIEESASRSPRRGDIWGQLSAIVALGALTYGFFEANARGWTDGVTLTSFGVAVVAFGVFLTVESVVAQPMLPLTMFANPAFAGAQVATFAISASMFAVFVYVTIYLQGVLGMSAIAAGLVYLPGTMVMLVVAGLTDKAVGRVPAWVLLSAALVAVAAGLAWMTIAGEHSSGWVMVPGFLLSCIGAGVFNPVMSGVVLAEAEHDDAGLAAGVNDVFRQSGIALGVAALGAVFPAASVLHGGDAGAYVDALRVALWISAAIAVVGAFVVVAAMRRARATTDQATGQVASGRTSTAATHAARTAGGEPTRTRDTASLLVVDSRSPDFRHPGPHE